MIVRSSTFAKSNQRINKNNDYAIENYKKTKSQTTKIDDHFIIRFSNHIKALILKKKRYFKCLKFDYRFIQNDVFCKHEIFVKSKQAMIMLHYIDIKWNEINAKNYDSSKAIYNQIIEKLHNDHESKN